ncbi:hypothetical protein KIN20_024484 [Parelaphostrongylus tenuis]|uniref:Uncharacterized protein n=1 Tax=Parelaphostrongylus tenuis TaxID=148309 RepID=A0AAD5NCV1_PARTN|nr:hypothetical protein KIN20_024484 [Parelaphostrongylus tenuis]
MSDRHLMQIPSFMLVEIVVSVFNQICSVGTAMISDGGSSELKTNMTLSEIIRELLDMTN